MKDMGTEEGVASGFGSIDSEHSLQIDLLRAFRGAVAGGHPGGDLDEILERLVDYTKVHFGSEQLLMRLYQYPHYQAHQDAHDATLERLDALRRAYREAAASATLDLADELHALLIDHIRAADRALGHYLVRLGVG